MIRNACLQNLSFLTQLLSKLHHLKILPKFSICKKFYRKALLFETNSFQSLANFNVKKMKMFGQDVVTSVYCCFISIKKFAICDN